LDVNTKQRVLRAPHGVTVHEGDVISIDGATGEVFLGEVPVVASPVVRYFEGEVDPNAEDAGDLVRAVHRMMGHADGVRRMAVRTNADTPEDTARARRFGAQGVGLCRTEHMFLGERRSLVEHLILADTDEERERQLAELLPLQRQDFVELLAEMDGLPVTIRLLDPPLHEFLPDITELSVRVAVAESRGEQRENDLRLLQAVHRLHEQNPMLGLRGVRLGVVIPGLFQMQARAILEAAAQRIKAGGVPRVEIMVPLVANVQEFETVKQDIIQVAREVREAESTHLEFLIGTMIELPRAALTADQIAEAAEFFSFGTNDLTQTTWGFSRDDVEAAFFSAYLEKGIFGVSPFESIDREGVGELVRIASEKGRAERPGLKLGVCGEHGGDPDSVHFFNEVGLDYVSCSPFRVPVARLEAGRATSMRRSR
jgi:pyruvate,orthophosphate dikinase